MKFITLFALMPLFAFAATTTEIDYKIPPAPIHHIIHSVSTEEIDVIQQMIKTASEKYGADRGVMLAIIESESHYNSTVQSGYPDVHGPNDREDSWGLVQIHLPDHPDITREQAQDKFFAINFLAKNLAEGHCHMWSTCPLH